MTNAEFYKEEAIKFDKEKDYCDDFIRPNILKPLGIDCGTLNCRPCESIVNIWFQEEYKKPEIKWENIPIDTPILVRDNDNAYWKKRHFAEFINGEIYAWDMGATSFSNTNDKVHWRYAKLWEGSEEQAAEKEAQCTD